jgi:molybdopterin molybdotransferase
MISVLEAEKIILDQAHAVRIASQFQRLEKAYGRILREDIAADRDQPAFNKSTMDGIAVRFDDWKKGQRAFKVEGVMPAGQPALKVNIPDGCVQIMTGAVVPGNYDCVVPIEQVTLEGGSAVIKEGSRIERGQFIRYQGADLKKGEVILSAGAYLLPPQIATAASFGRSKIKVSAKARVAVISTGDELVDIDRKNIRPFEIRKSNSYALDAMLIQTGLCETEIFHFADDKKLLLRELKKALNKFDILVLSGGVSMGEFDFVPQVLEELGVQVLFHKVAQKPGKPFWFGKNKNGKIVFALPGNPVSTQICAYRYLIPYLHKALGLPYNVQWAILNEEYSSNTDLTFFVPVKIFSEDNATLNASPVTTGGSGDYASLSQADGFLELEASRKHFPQGFIAPYYSW